MRTSSDYFNRDTTSFENLDQDLTPRPTVPLFPNTLLIKPNLPPPPKFPPAPVKIQSLPREVKPRPKVNYPVYVSTPKPTQNTALAKIQQEIQKEVDDLQKSKPTLDQLIQNALKQKIEHDHQAAKQKIVTIKKISSPVPNPYISQTPKPTQRPSRQLWWPNEDEVTPPVTKANLTPVNNKITPNPASKIELKSTPLSPPIQEPNIKDIPATPKPNFLDQSSLFLTSLVQTFDQPDKPKVTIAAAPKPISATQTGLHLNTSIQTLPTKSVSTTPLVMAKTAFHISLNLINYFLFIVSPEVDPYNDSNRQFIVYGIKASAYLIILAGIFELLRNLKLGWVLNGQLEVMSIFLISAILFFFGENLNILFPPINPYQIHEVV